jgi:hypothetical protein
MDIWTRVFKMAPKLTHEEVSMIFYTGKKYPLCDVIYKRIAAITPHMCWRCFMRIIRGLFDRLEGYKVTENLIQLERELMERIRDGLPKGMSPIMMIYHSQVLEAEVARLPAELFSFWGYGICALVVRWREIIDGLNANHRHWLPTSHWLGAPMLSDDPREFTSFLD